MEITKYDELCDLALERDMRLTNDELMKISGELNRLGEAEDFDELDRVYILILHHFMISKATKVVKNGVSKKKIAPYKGKAVSKTGGVMFTAKNLPDDLNEILYCLFFL